MADLPGNINGFTAWGGNPPVKILSADGSSFWGRSEKGNATIYYAVYWQKADGSIVLVWRSGVNAGQGTIAVQPNGQLFATYFVVAGDSQVATSAFIPEYKPFPVPQGVPGARGLQGPQGIQGPKGDPGVSGAGTDPLFEGIRLAIKQWLMR